MTATSHHYETCASCGAPIQGRYCAACGEANVHDGDLAVAHLTHDFAHEFTHLDGKIWRTIRALLIEPGRLTAEYWRGRRGPWVRPLRLYLVITALQLLLASNASGPLGLRVWLDNRNGGENYSVGQRPPQLAQGSPVTEEFNHRVQAIYLWVRYLSLGLFAIAALGLYRKRQPYYGAHLIFGLHYYAFQFLVSGLMVRLAPDANPLIVIAIGYAYLFFALRRLYHQKLPITLGKSILLFNAVAVAEMVAVGASVSLAVYMHSH